MLKKDLLDILACPKCKSVVTKEDGSEEQVNLEYDQENSFLICNTCRLKFRVENDIPIMLLDQAESF